MKRVGPVVFPLGAKKTSIVHSSRKPSTIVLKSQIGQNSVPSGEISGHRSDLSLVELQAGGWSGDRQTLLVCVRDSLVP